MFKTICFKVKKVAINFFIKSDYIRIKEGKIGIKTIDVCILPCNKFFFGQNSMFLDDFPCSEFNYIYTFAV